MTPEPWRRLRRIRRILDAGRAGERIRDELDEELDFHYRRTVEELRARGMRGEEAEREARRRFGNEDRYRAELERIDGARERRRRRVERMETVRQNLVFAFRGMRRNPGFTAVIVAMLTLGIGANAVIFGVIDRLLLSPPDHVAEPDRVALVHFDRVSVFTGRQGITTAMAYPDLVDFDEVEPIAMAAGWAEQTLTLGTGLAADRVVTHLATASLFPTLGVRPHLGRFFGPDEDRFGGTAVAVLSHGFWTRRFGADPDVLGQELDLGDGRYTVVGVAPRGFTGATLRPVDLWLPLRSAGPTIMGDGWQEARRWYAMHGVVRLREGVSLEAAAAAATAAHRAGRSEEVALGRYDEGARVVLGSLVPGRGVEPGQEVAIARWLGGVALFVLLIACANVANLFLARAVRWRRELAVRVALGVGRGRLLGQLLTESALMAALGALGALAAAYWGGRAIYATLLPELDPGTALTSPRLLAFTGVASLLTVVLAGLPPALRASRPDVTGELKAGRHGAPSAERVRSLLLIGQVALSVALLVGAGLFVRSLSMAHGVELGFRPEGLVWATVEMEEGGAWGEESARAIVLAGERVEGLPGVSGVARANLPPFSGLWGMSLRTPDRDSIPFDRGPYVFPVSSDYHQVVGLPILRGRGFTEEDLGEGAAPVAILTEDLARTVFGDEEPLGACVLVADTTDDPAPCTRVVGVSADMRLSALVEDESPAYFVPASHPAAPSPPRTLLVRASGDPGEVAGRVRRAIDAAVPGVRYVDIGLVEEQVGAMARAWRLGATLFGVFGALALVVASLGLYSLVSFDVARRRRELGIRSALGASRRRIVGAVFRQALVLAGAGAAVGLLVALAAAGFSGDLLFQVSPTDPAVYATSALLMVGVAALAAVLPARRASLLDPAESLRAE